MWFCQQTALCDRLCCVSTFSSRTVWIVQEVIFRRVRYLVLQIPLGHTFSAHCFLGLAKKNQTGQWMCKAQKALPDAAYRSCDVFRY